MTVSDDMQLFCDDESKASDLGNLCGPSHVCPVAVHDPQKGQSAEHTTGSLWVNPTGITTGDP